MGHYQLEPEAPPGDDKLIRKRPTCALRRQEVKTLTRGCGRPGQRMPLPLGVTARDWVTVRRFVCLRLHRPTGWVAVGDSMRLWKSLWELASDCRSDFFVCLSRVVAACGGVGARDAACMRQGENRDFRRGGVTVQARDCVVVCI